MKYSVKVPLWLAISSSLRSMMVQGYVTSGLPCHVHQAWLKKMTNNICDASPGELTPEMCLSVPELMSAWAQNPYVSHVPVKQRNRIHHADVYPHHGRECALATEQLLKRLIDEHKAGNEDAIATTDAYNVCLDIWARSGEGTFAAQRAEQILIAMQDMYAAGDWNVQPNTQTFRSVILAWEKAGNGHNSQIDRAHQVLQWMIHLYKMDDNDYAVPDMECFNIVLRGWAASSHPDAPIKAEGLLIQMDQLFSEGILQSKPTTKHFNHILSAWSRSSHAGAPRRAEDILHHMEILSESDDNDIEPNFVSYSIVSAAWAKSGIPGAAEKAQVILNILTKKAMINDDHYLYPDMITYNIVIDAWAKEDTKKAPQRARALLDQQIDMYTNKGIKKCRPDVYGYTSVISSCARTKGSWKDKKNAFEIAKQTFDELIQCDYTSPNHVTYGTMLKACAKLLPAESKQRQKYVRKYFREACKNGCAGDMVFRRLGEAASPELNKKLLRDYEGYLKEWTMNIPDNEKNAIQKKIPVFDNKKKLLP